MMQKSATFYDNDNDFSEDDAANMAKYVAAEAAGHVVSQAMQSMKATR